MAQLAEPDCSSAQAGSCEALAHIHLQYRKVAFPIAAKQWIQNNIELQYYKLIDVQIYTKEQNDFVRTFGFITPLLHRINVTNIKEIIVNSTFKTNQERFELFVVNANCGGYGMPIAYLYLLICDGMVEAYNDPKNQVNTRMQALHKFFANLRNEKLLPIFVLDKKLKVFGYTKNKAIEAHQQFNFIEPLWIPTVGYLWVNWYNKKDWKLFARLAYSLAIPLARTTMITESYWRIGTLFPAWWQTFKRDWNKAANTKIEPGMDERYHIDEVNWICSCPAYFHNPYFLCKHLVAKKNILLTFMETIRHHDYPLVFFSSEKVASICQENDPWKKYGLTSVIDDDFTERSYPNSGILHNTELEKIDTSFDALMKPIVKAIEKCDKKLSARTQQNTWGSKNGKLAFWLR
ncbi:hypothetical protein RhiirA4_478319 [Rhizophagus irregularis]|uniref:SWIM-type domain-containing protein n=1 Tax=Rhizophagus irregularis TaxID=588596 RepID=A0A2I1HEK5_9GLOM|nr:hypothetical protein RhiirA4_478319 [Rhizophagus irregularis]